MSNLPSSLQMRHLWPVEDQLAALEADRFARLRQYLVALAAPHSGELAERIGKAPNPVEPWREAVNEARNG